MLKIGKRLLEALEEMFFMVELHIEFSIVLSLSDFYYCKDQFRVCDFLKLCSSPCMTGNLMGSIFDLSNINKKHLRFFVWLRGVTLSRL